MRLGGRLLAAMEILTDILTHHRPAALALQDWGRRHRFAGARDRAVIGNLVYDALRRKASLAWRMGNDSPRALILGVLAHGWHMAPDDISALCDGSRFAPAPLTEEERAGLCRPLSDTAPAWVQGDFPETFAASFTRAFGAAAVAEGQALAQRAPLDIRVNLLKANREKVRKALQGRPGTNTAPQDTTLSPWGLRFPPPPPEGRHPNVEAMPAHGKGWFEVQDEGSQIAAFLAEARPGQQVLDLCAGAGGKTLALAAAMENRGQIYAYDTDPQRLRPIFERLKRAGVRNCQVLPPGDTEKLKTLPPLDLVFVDAPCSGSGSWRRRPDAKWRLTPASLAKRCDTQRQLLNQAAALLRPGGRLIYVTCSLLPEENGDQAQAFLAAHPDFSPDPLPNDWQDKLGLEGEPPTDLASPDTPDAAHMCQLTPARHGTDGFFIARFQRSDA